MSRISHVLLLAAVILAAGAGSAAVRWIRVESDAEVQTSAGRTMEEETGIPPAAMPKSASHGPFAVPWIGYALNAHHIGDLPLYLKSVDRIAEEGANALIVLSPMFMETTTSSEIRFLPDRCATDEQLIAILTRAKQRSMRTILLPIVLLDHPTGKEWRGIIKPDDWDRWWLSYDKFLDRFIRISNKANVDVLCVGSELNSAEPQLDHWRRVIAQTRKRFNGLLSYSSNWDRFYLVEFWKELDVMCVSSYFELIEDEEEDPARKGAPPPSVEQLAKTWHTERDKMLAFAKKIEKPMLISEVGYPSLSWAAEHPWNYVAPAGTKADHEAQARCWAAFFAAWTDVFTGTDRSAAGVLCYHWDPYYHGEEKDIGYGVDGKPALKVIREAFAKIRASRVAAP
jgi:hypothetical protein